MDTKVIQLHELPLDVAAYLQTCSESGEAVVVELPDSRFVAIQPLIGEEHLMDRLIADDPTFRKLLAKSAVSGRKPFSFEPSTTQE